jgi:hypothetical protein
MSKDRPEGNNSDHSSAREHSESLSREANEGPPPRRNIRNESPNSENPNSENPNSENPCPENPKPENPRPNEPRPRESSARDRRDNDYLFVPPIFEPPFTAIQAQGEVRSSRHFSEDVDDITGTSVRAQNGSIVRPSQRIG